MDWMYRGYPQGLVDVVTQAVNSEPYMLYNREEQQGWTEKQDKRRRVQAEYDYVRGLYPMSVRRWQRLVEEELDRNDGLRSSIYDEYPDREWLYWVRNRILDAAGEGGVIENQDMVMILVLYEMLKRRSMRRQ